MFRPSVGHRQVVYTEEDTKYNMQVFRCTQPPREPT